MASLVLFTMILLPILAGCLFIFTDGIHEKRLLRWLPAILIAALILAFLSQTTISASITWQPTAGEMSVSFERSAIILCLLVSVGFLIINHQTRTTPDMLTPLQTSLVFFSFSFAIIALTAEHFLLRFAALEFVGLCVVATALTYTLRDGENWKNIIKIFINFKLGDLALLASILLMQTSSGTFLIGQSLEMALLLPPTEQIVVTVGLLTAVWVKLSIWPLDKWVQAASGFSKPLRVWFADLLMPILGAYLLYRTSPLLSINNKFTTVIIIAAVSAVVAKSFNVMLRKQVLPHQRLKQIFSNVCLIPLAALGQQDLFWSFVLFWFIARLSYSIYILQHEHSPPSINARRISFYYVSSFLLHSFSFLALLHVSISNSLSSALLVILWFLWGLITFKDLGQIPAGDHLAANKKASHWIHLLTIIANILFTIAIILFVSSLIFLTTHYVKGGGIWILPNFIGSRPTLSAMLYGLVTAALSHIFLRRNIEKIGKFVQRRLPAKRFGDPIQKAARTIKMKDPLDQTTLLYSLFMNAALFIYRAIEKNSLEKIISLLRKIFSFLFNKIEKLTSKELWIKVLHFVLGSSRKIQKWHPGYLRLNLFFFLFFIIILMLVIINQNIGFIVLPK